MTTPVTVCRDCAAWVSRNGDNGICRHEAPRPTEEADQIARWPETLAQEFCGEAVPRTADSIIVVCRACVFWRQGVEKRGLYPADRRGEPLAWWQNTGHCLRYAPGPASAAGHRGFWRVTHSTDGCAGGRAVA